MVTPDTYVVIFYSLLQLTTSWADDSHEHVHIKLHLPEVVRKHTHMRMIYKHHFHPKKIKFHDYPAFDTTLPLLKRPFHAAPDLSDIFKFGIKSQIIDIKKPKIKFPKLTEWDFDNSIPLSSIPVLGGKYKHPNLRNNFQMKMPEYDVTEEMKYFPKISQMEEDEDEDADRNLPSDLSLYDTNYSHADALMSPQWSFPSLKDQDVPPSIRWSLPTNDWMDSMKYRFRGQAGNDDKIMQAFDTYSTKSNFNDAMELPFDKFENSQKRFKQHGSQRFRKNKTQL